jgi:uroporphyrinogen-III synthase
MINTNSKPYVLILREIERASLLKEILIENNINVIVEPLYKIQPIKFKSINFLNYQSLLITSVNTVKILTEKFSKEELNTIKTYCVGKVTEKYALEAGFNCIKTNSNSGITLAKNVIKKSTYSNKKILMIGATVLAYDPTAIFKKANLEIEKVHIYKTIPYHNLSEKSLDLLNKEKINNIIVYSPETAKIFLKLAKGLNTKNIIITCLGNSTEKILTENKWKKIQVLKNTELKSIANKIISSII